MVVTWNCRWEPCCQTAVWELIGCGLILLLQDLAEISQSLKCHGMGFGQSRFGSWFVTWTEHWCLTAMKVCSIQPQARLFLYLQLVLSPFSIVIFKLFLINLQWQVLQKIPDFLAQNICFLQPQFSKSIDDEKVLNEPWQIHHSNTCKLGIDEKSYLYVI